MVRLVAVPLVLAIPLAAAPRLKGPPKGASPIVGTWRMTWADGQAQTLRSSVTYHPDGTRVTREQVQDKEQVTRSRYAIDARSDPAGIDLILESAGPDAGPSRGRGIFKVEGDTLTVCFGLAGRGERPTAFTPKAGEAGVWVFERAKPED